MKDSGITYTIVPKHGIYFVYTNKTLSGVPQVNTLRGYYRELTDAMKQVLELEKEALGLQSKYLLG